MVVLFALVCFFPFYLIVINSFLDNKVLNQNGYQLYIRKFSLDSYKYLFQGSQAYTSYKVTIFVTVVGAALGTAITSMYSFVLAHRKARYRNILAFLTYVPMVVGTGLVGFYLLVAHWLHLKDTIWALIFPYLLNPFLVFVLVNFFRALPYEIYESASIDGANDIRTFFQIVLPISIPGHRHRHPVLRPDLLERLVAGHPVHQPQPAPPPADDDPVAHVPDQRHAVRDGAEHVYPEHAVRGAQARNRVHNHRSHRAAVSPDPEVLRERAHVGSGERVRKAIPRARRE